MKSQLEKSDIEFIPKHLFDLNEIFSKKGFRILKEETKKSLNSIVKYYDYDFDRVNVLDDVIEVVKIFESLDVNIISIFVKEFADYENGPLRLGYSSIDDLKKSIWKDFDDKIIEDFLINGVYEDIRLSVAIYSYDSNSRMMIRYFPQL